MGRKNKLLKRLLSLPKDFTFDEVVAVLAFFHFHEKKTGKTSGSVVKFINEKFIHEPIIFHRPHPQHIVKIYILKSIISCLLRCKLISYEEK